MTGIDPDPAEDWLVILTGPVGNTYVRMPLTATEVAVLRDLVWEAAALAGSDTLPGIRITPWAEVTDTQRRRYAQQRRHQASA
ncbi:hypothetical protein [Nocardia sp. NPDC127526]|uniref:hypothetical protein n=1 Tax=Nocardia sp. NPDC127526 TaxID=3345393 RepID=UPI00363E5077